MGAGRAAHEWLAQLCKVGLAAQGCAVTGCLFGHGGLSAERLKLACESCVIDVGQEFARRFATVRDGLERQLYSFGIKSRRT